MGKLVGGKMFILKNKVVKRATAGDLVCVCGVVDFSTSPATEIITHHPDNVKTGDGWAEAIPVNPLIIEGGKNNRRKTVSFKKYDWREAFEIKKEASKYGWAEAVKIPK